MHADHDLALLAASLLALGVGPLVYHAAKRSRLALVGLHAAIVIAIFALIVLHILPECVEAAGWLALLAAGAGLLGPVLAEGRWQHGSKQATGLALLLALGALALHSFADGMALVGGHGHGHEHGHDVVDGLGLAVVLHNIPVGAALWWLLKARGRAVAIGALGAMAAATACGFAFGGRVLPGLDAVSVALFQAFVGGVLLHVLIHPHKVAHAPGGG